eukprot:4659849-Pleurochrysis_carterae.AAC.1
MERAARARAAHADGVSVSVDGCAFWGAGARARGTAVALGDDLVTHTKGCGRQQVQTRAIMNISDRHCL